jgi:nitronate monooxygenase
LRSETQALSWSLNATGAGIKVIAMVTTVAEALAVQAAGVDAVVAQGTEAGGHWAQFEKTLSPQHRGIGTMALIPQVVDALRIPVIAAGGIADGRGVISAFALGASGVLMNSVPRHTRIYGVPFVQEGGR